MNAMNAKLDVLMPMVTETRGIKEHLGTLNGSVAKQRDQIHEHDKMFASLLEKMGNFFEDAQEIKMMRLPQMIERVDWIYRFFWIIATASLGAIVAALFALLLK